MGAEAPSAPWDLGCACASVSLAVAAPALRAGELLMGSQRLCARGSSRGIFVSTQGSQRCVSA